MDTHTDTDMKMDTNDVAGYRYIYKYIVKWQNRLERVCLWIWGQQNEHM